MEWGLSVYCPSCGAQPAEHCYSTLGKTVKVHVARVSVMMNKRESFEVPNTRYCLGCGGIYDDRMAHRCPKEKATAFSWGRQVVRTGSYGEIHINGQRYSERQQNGHIKGNPTGGMDG